jgi:hypothetical protein
LWPDSIRIALGPERASGRRIAFGLRRRTGARMEAEGAPAESLARLFPALGAGRASVSVTLSNRLARYLVLPPSPALGSETDWLLFAERRLAALTGADAAAHRILLSSSRAGGARLACAVERRLLDAIEAAVGAAGHRLASLQPHFAAAFNLARRGIGKQDTWFVDREPQQLTIGLAIGGEWRAVRQRRVEADWREQLPAILQREGQLAGIAAGSAAIQVAAWE